MRAQTRLRQTVLLALAAVLALGLAAAPPSTTVVYAATPDLTLVSNARYDVQPDDRRVAVTVDIVARNHLKDTATRRYYFDRTFLAVPAGSTNFKITSPDWLSRLAVATSRGTSGGGMSTS